MQTWFIDSFTPKSVAEILLYCWNVLRCVRVGWWTRELTSEYMPAVSRDDSNLVNYLKHMGIIDDKVGSDNFPHVM